MFDRLGIKGVDNGTDRAGVELSTYHAGKLSVLEHADIPQPQLGEALVYQVHRRLYIQRNGRLCLVSVLSLSRVPSTGQTYRIDIGGEIRRVNLAVILVNTRYIRHQTKVVSLVRQIVERVLQVRCGD